MLASPGCFFLQGEPQENSCRESLSEALAVLDALVIKVWTVGRLERRLRDHYGLIRSTKDASNTPNLCFYPIALPVKKTTQTFLTNAPKHPARLSTHTSPHTPLALWAQNPVGPIYSSF